MQFKNTASLACVVPLLFACKGADTQDTPVAAISASTVSPAPPTAPPQSTTSESIAKAQARAAKLAMVAVLNTQIAFIERARKANLELAELVIYDEGNDPNNLLGRPGQYVAKANWKTKGKDGTLEVFANVDDAKARKDYVDSIGKASPMFLQYSFLNEGVAALLRIPKQVTPTKAQEWDALLQGIKPADVAPQVPSAPTP